MPIQIDKLDIVVLESDPTKCVYTVTWHLTDTPTISNVNLSPEVVLDATTDVFTFGFWPEGATFT